MDGDGIMKPEITDKKCYVCGKGDLLMFRDSEQGEDKYICIDHRNMKMLKELAVDSEVSKDYIIKWKLMGPEGETWIETFECCDMADFEVIYGNNVYTILWCQIRRRDQAMF